MAKANLSVLMHDLRGKSGTVVFRKTKVGTVVSPRSVPSNPSTPAQRAVRSALTTVTRQWKNFNAPQIQAWEAYAEENAPSYDSGINAFAQLGTKVILINGGGTAPTTPPTSAFSGDDVSITVTASAGKLTFTANAPNGDDIVTELLIQRLKSKNRKPSAEGYRTAGFYAFRAGGLSTQVALPAGYYAAGYRFVYQPTGQMSLVVTVPVSGPVGFETTDSGSGAGSSSSSKRKAA